MPEDAPKKRYKARIIDGGLVPSDDPMFSSGWRMALPLESPKSTPNSLRSTDGTNPKDQANRGQGGGSGGSGAVGIENELLPGCRRRQRG
jgi:hypothetical protein